MAEHISHLILTVLYNTILFFVCLSIFFLYRAVRARPGTTFSEIETSSLDAIRRLLSIDDTELASYIHLEGYLYLNFIKNTGFFLLSSSLITTLTLIPLYANLNLSPNTYLSHLSIATQDPSTYNLTVPALCAFLLAFSTYWLAYSYFILPRSHPSLFPSVFSI